MMLFLCGALPMALAGFLFGAGYGYKAREKDERRKAK